MCICMCVYMYAERVYVTTNSVTVLLETLDSAIEDCRNGRVTPPLDTHNRVKLLYTWQDVAGRTEKV